MEGEKKVAYVHRFYKFMSSKSMNTKLGRKMMMQGLGEHGSLLAKGLVEITTSVLEEEEGNRIIKDALKLIVKTQTVLSFQGEEFDQSHSKMVSGDVFRFGFEILYLLDGLVSQCKRRITDFTSELIEPVMNSLSKCLEIWKILMKPHLSVKNFEMMSEFVLLIQDHKLVLLMLNSEKFSQLRSDLVENVRGVLELFMIHIPQSDSIYCSVDFCGKHCMLPYGLFEGSELCPAHHAQKYNPLLQYPSVWLFTLPRFRGLFSQYLRGDQKETCARDKKLFGILCGIRDFEDSSSLKRRMEICKEMRAEYEEIGQSKGLLREIGIPEQSFVLFLRKLEQAGMQRSLVYQNLFRESQLRDKVSEYLQQIHMAGFQMSREFAEFQSLINPSKRSIRESRSRHSVSHSRV